MEGCGDHGALLGFRFKPTEQELVSDYLLRKTLGFHDSDVIIPTCDMYGETNPWDLWEILKQSQTFNGGEVYVFTKHKKKTVNGSRVDRTIGLGCWSGEDAPKAVYSVDDPRLKVGARKRFRFEKSGTEHDGGWIMLEYSLEKSWLKKVGVNHQNIVNDLVICKFKKNPRRQPQSRSNSVVAVTSLGSDEENEKGNKRPRKGSEADNDSQSAIVVESDNDHSKGDRMAGNRVMVNDPMSSGGDDELQEYTKSLEKEMLMTDNAWIENEQVMANDPLSSGADDELKEYTKGLENELLMTEYAWTENEQVMVNDRSEQDLDDSNTYIDLDCLFDNHPELAPGIDDQSKGEGMSNPIVAVTSTGTADENNMGVKRKFQEWHVDEVGPENYKRPRKVGEANLDSQSVILVESDNDQGKGNQWMANNQVMVSDPSSFGADDKFEGYLQSSPKELMTDNAWSEYEQIQQWDDSNRCIDFDLLFSDLADLSPGMDDLWNLHPQTAPVTATAAADANALFQVEGSSTSGYVPSLIGGYMHK